MYGRIGVSAFAKHLQLRRDLLIIVAVPKSSLTSLDAGPPPQPTAHFDRNNMPAISGTGHSPVRVMREPT